MARCSRCGWEYDLNVYVCDNCGYILKRERIERLPIFRRPEAKVYKPNRPIVRIIKILNPFTAPFAFRDINNKKDKRGFKINILLSALFFSFWIIAVSLKIDPGYFGTLPLTGISISFTPFSFDMGNRWIKFILYFFIFLIFFVFGLIYYNLIFKLYNWVFSIAANFSVQLDDVLAVRFNVKRKKKRYQNVLSGAAVLRRKVLRDENQYSFEKLSKGKDVMTKIKHTGKSQIMGYSYAPIFVANLVSFIFLSLFLLFMGSDLGANNEDLWDSWIWTILDLLQIIAIFWVAILISIAQREIGNTNTTKLLIGNAIIAFIISFTTIILRPTLGGGGLNLIDRFIGGT